MIGSIRGKIIYKSRDRVEIETGGIGWEVFLSSQDLAKLSVGKEAELFIFHHVAETANDLYGFLSRKDKQVFALLLSVSGVGPKTAIEIFSAGNGERILRAVAEADVEFFRRVKGVGKKGAQRIIVDLKSKAGDIKELDLAQGRGGNDFVYQALRGLGFTQEEIAHSLRDLPEEIKSDSEIVKYALRQLAKNGSETV
jgi:Holliday junction DNA helicase RuvA